MTKIQICHDGFNFEGGVGDFFSNCKVATIWAFSFVDETGNDPSKKLGTV